MTERSVREIAEEYSCYEWAPRKVILGQAEVSEIIRLALFAVAMAEAATRPMDSMTIAQEVHDLAREGGW